MSSHMSATAVRVLLLLDLPDTRLFMCNEECYLIRKLHPKYINVKVYDALYHAGFISQPQAIGGGLAECLMTTEGHAKATRIREAMSEYYQLCLFDEEDTEEAAELESAEITCQLGLFDEDTTGVAASRSAQR